ncbi:MAG: glycine cleavage system aminomethyltransferase GcvT [Burkholderiaceae bacterium]
MSELRKTALHSLHVELGARMVEFAGYSMPVQYPLGVLKEHLHTRAAAGLFDVSHMGQLRLLGPDAAAALESLVPVDLLGLLKHQQRYALFTNEEGGILDDLMVTRIDEGLFVIVNAACKDADTAHVRGALAARVQIEVLDGQSLLALQGPAAASVMQRLLPETSFRDWTFMTARSVSLCGAPCLVTRSGYTGEDGFEISVPDSAAETLARTLLKEPEVQAIGLGARDSLRLEAGLCLYGHDIDTGTTPVEAALAWAISKARRSDGDRPGGFPGASAVLGQLEKGSRRKRVGFIGIERTPVREGTPLLSQGEVVGRVTSGGFSPTSGAAIAMGYVPAHLSKVDTELFAKVRERLVPLRVAKTPFVPNHYYRGSI